MKNRLRLFIVILLLFIFMSSCSDQKKYSYINVTDERGISELKELLSNAEVPSDDIDTLIGYVTKYSNGTYASSISQDDWKMVSITKPQYDYTSAINAFTSNPFNDLNCRQAVFLIYHSFYTTSSAEDNAEKDEYKEISHILDNEGSKYSSLFPDLPLKSSVKDSVLNYWKDKNAIFSGGDVHLVSMWGEMEGNIEILHCGILIHENNDIIFFEKTDPMLPYQLSKFNSANDLKKYLLNRTDKFNDMTVFVDNEAL